MSDPDTRICPSASICRGSRYTLPRPLALSGPVLRNCYDAGWGGLRRKELHMGILEDLLGNEQLQKQYKDFVKRYEQGDPSEGYSNKEVLERYGEVSHSVPPDEYAKAAIEALSKLSPDERVEFFEDAARASCSPRREAGGKGGIRPAGPGKRAHRST